MSMLRDADLSLENWLGRVLPPGTGVRFDAPRPDWERRRSGAAFVSAFLCEVHRDEQDLPRAGWSDARDGDGRLVGRQAAPRYYRLVYLVTAWADAAGGDDEASRRTIEEHELLGRLVDACTGTEALAADLLTGVLAEAAIPSFVRCASGEAARSTRELWSGFGIAPHAHLVLELVAPVVPPIVTELAPPAREIVLGASQLSAPGPAEDAPASADAAPARPAGTVRRWERSTIIERAAGKPGRPGS